jgi:hypothetical protein
VATDLLSVHDGAVIVRGFFGNLVYCWFASEISEGCCQVSGCWVSRCVECRAVYRGNSGIWFSGSTNRGNTEGSDLGGLT